MLPYIRVFQTLLRYSLPQMCTASEGQAKLPDTVDMSGLALQCLVTPLCGAQTAPVSHPSFGEYTDQATQDTGLLR